MMQHFNGLELLLCKPPPFSPRDLDCQLASLKAAKNDLQLRNELLMQANTELKTQMNVVSLPGEDIPLASNSVSSLNGSSLSLSVNVDISNLPSTTSTATVTTGTSTVGLASASLPIALILVSEGKPAIQLSGPQSTTL